MIGWILATKIALAAQATLPAPQAAAAPDAGSRVIVRLGCRSHDLAHLSTSHGVRYSATDKQGRTIVANVTLGDLRQHHPEIYRLLVPVVVDRSGEAKAILLDASIRE